MHWYGGSIAEAVALSKQKNAIFVVFVEGNNDLSAEMAATIDDEAVLCRLSNATNFLAVKLKSGTENYTHFAQIYQFVPVPSLFFIGRNGTPLEVVCAGVEASNLASRIDRILAEHHAEKLPVPSAQPSTSSATVRENTEHPVHPTTFAQQTEAQAASPPKEEQKASGSRKSESVSTPGSSSPPNKVQKMENTDNKPMSETEIVCDGDVCVRRPKEAASTSSQAQPAAVASANTQPPEEAKPVPTTSSTSNIEDKVDRAKEIIDARRREKEEKEKELQRQKELERRNTGQGVAELKRWQAEQELKQIQEERKREKLENNLARQRILEQIAQDRAERRARDLPVAAQPQPTAPQTTAANAPPATSGDSHGSARIQFKLPDGTSHTANFAATGTLRTVHEYVADNLQLSTSNFSLWTAFPRRELVETDSTLSELQLAPSAALLVLPRRGADHPPRETSFAFVAFITQLLTSLLYSPTLQLYEWVRTRLFPRAAVPPPAPPPPAPPAPRRRGNVHRLPGDAPDDDNNTWNGNSTQQM